MKISCITKTAAMLCAAASLFAGALFTGSCSGNADPDSLVPVLSADKTRISADGKDKVVFKVISADTDVTEQATIVCTSHPELNITGNSFSTLSEGKYVFSAKYNGAVSSKVTVTAIKSEVHKSKYVRKALVMEFTGQWCSFCPQGYRNLKFYLDSYYKESSYVLAMHNDDDFTIKDVQSSIERAFSVPSFPVAVVDYRDLCGLSNFDDLDNSMPRSFKDFPAHCGVAVSSDYDEDAKKAMITVKVTPETAAPCRVAVWILEDGITARQKDGGIEEPKYIHNHVARKVVSANWRGDKIRDMEVGKESIVTYEVAADSEWNIDNTSVYAVVLDDNADESKICVNNVQACAFKDGNTDYSYVAE